MAGIEVAGCVAAVVSAFHGAGDLVQALRDKGDKKRRRKEHEIEQAHEEKMLHKALVEGAKQVQLASVDRRQRFGRAFDIGDSTATSELKDIMISMQTEVISVLQFAKTVENTPLDCSPLYEAAITNKKAATRAMDELCQRIATAIPARRQYGDERSSSPAYSPQRRVDALHYRSGSEPSVKYRVPPLQYGSSSRVHTRSLVEAQPARHSMDLPLQRMTSTITTAGYPYARDRRTDAAFAEQLEEEDEDIDTSIHDSAIGNNESFTQHCPTTSVASTVLSDETAYSNDSEESGAKRDEVRIVQSPDHRFSFNSSDGSATAYHSGASTPAQFAVKMLQSLSHTDHDEDAFRANSAPEVVTKEYEPRILSPASPTLPLPIRSTRPDSAYTDIFAPEPERLWSPLNRPAAHNNYHNFCKGAWNTRQNLQEGLAIAMIPNYKNQVVAHWKCKHCDFRSRGMNNSKVLPDQVYFSKNGVRYRWLFLAKSHVPANRAHAKPELYAYGCVFCAAQGRMTQVYESLDKMMEHVVGKHRTEMLTPEVLAKTRCIVGGAPSREEDWDVNIPNTTRRIVTNDVKDFVVSAVTGIL